MTGNNPFRGPLQNSLLGNLLIPEAEGPLSALARALPQAAPPPPPPPSPQSGLASALLGLAVSPPPATGLGALSGLYRDPSTSPLNALSGYGISVQPKVKRKTFVSYHHGGDQWYYDRFSSVFHDRYEVISDRSLDRARDSNDPEYILRYIRERHITGSSTVIVLCGLETPKRKYVDWEIEAALRQETALVGIKLPSVPIVGAGCNKPARLQDNIDSGYAKWDLWEKIIESPDRLLQLIEDANNSSKRLIRNSRARMRKNG